MTRQIDEIIIHCAATRPDWMQGQTAEAKRDEIRRWHKDRGWRDIGYHYFIDRNGRTVAGRPLQEAGAHTKGHNSKSIGICLAGGHGSSENDAFLDNYTFEQEQALRVLINELKVRIPGIKKITGHNQYAAKACPGFNVPRWLANQPPKPVRTSAVQSKTMQASAISIGGALGTAGSVIGGLDQYAQYIVLGFVGVVVLAALFIMRERLKKWADGDR
jgi:hypothetical protein